MSCTEKPVPLAFNCDLCPKVFTLKKNLVRHQNDSHNRQKNRLLCSICHFACNNNSNYCDHLKLVHEIEIQTEQLVFNTNEEFLRWKKEIEKDTSSFYVKQATSADGKIWFYCNRSGKYVPKGKGLRHLKIQGTRKIGERCPSSIVVNPCSDSKLSINFVKTHVGHSIELKHIDIPKDDKLELAGMLALGIPRQTVLEKIRATWCEDNSRRVHLSTNRDLLNIAREMEINASIIRDKNDLISLESWIEEMRDSDTDPIIFYLCDEEKKTFMLGISTLGQRYMLEKYGSNIVAIDSTHGTNNYDFQLTTLMIVDENRNGFPVAFFYSSAVDTSTCKVFFESLKACCNVPHASIFMSDDFNGYYNAWIEVFPKPKYHLLCCWHVYRNWNKHLNQVKDIDLRSKIRSDIFYAQKVLDEEEFKRLYNLFLTKYNENELAIPFLKYIETYYGNRVEQWAACYRKGLGINTNMYLENLHRNLKYVYMNGKKIRRMDESISFLMRLVYNMQFEKVVRNEKGYLPRKLSELRNKHQVAINSEFQYSVDPVNGNAYSVISSTGQEVNLYTVEFIVLQEKCSCLLRCDVCDICVASVTCDCYDYAIKGNLCKHTHYIALKRNSILPVNACQAEEQELIVDTDNHAEEIRREKHIMLSQNSQPLKSKSLDSTKQELITEVTAIINSCKDENQLAAVKKCITSMRTTIFTIESSPGSLERVSDNPYSQGSGKKIDQQKRFWKGKESKRCKKQLRYSTLDLENFIDSKNSN